MKKRFLAIILALAMCIGLAVPAFAADTGSVTASGISFNAITTSQYESYRASLEESVAEGYSWAPALLEEFGETAAFQYHIGLINYGPEDGFRDFWPYLVKDDVVLDFNVKEGEKFTMEGYYLSVGEPEISGVTTYVATYIGGGTFTAREDGYLADKALIDQYYPGANYVYCYRGDYNPDISEEETIRIVFADENAVPRTVPSFTDVLANAYYAAPVAWAVQNEITSGTGDNRFSPAQDCTNAQILTFIWRAYGKPEPAIDDPFANSIPDGYKSAAVWAYEKGMVSGTAFDADKPCTRAMAMTYLWQAAGSPETELSGKFTDVAAGAPYAQAVAWAVANGITQGATDTTFAPENICQRGQIAVFLYNALARKA